ncbi:MAG: hypothetical protein FJX18_06260, partial [Alphaproteobacteria bacterium]|nr:hypothetical protein [Alphaproteobacteria bacterium]
MKQFILSILLISGIAQAATDDGVRSFEVSGGTRYVRGRFNMETEGRTLVTTPTPPTKARSEAVGVYTDRPRS